jgi:prepilin-type N-terminal cleavage/methylation domain-containing protein
MLRAGMLRGHTSRSGGFRSECALATGNVCRTKADGPRSSLAAPRQLRSERALTLVEMLVSLVILGIVLAATAASLITFTQTARANERQAQATATLSQFHELFQGVTWDVLGTLPSDLEGLDAPNRLGNALSIDDDDLTEWKKLEDDDDPAPGTDPLTFTGDDGVEREIVLTGDPSGAIPAYQEGFVANDGREYDIYQIVTWVDTTGDGNPDLKRLTAIARWDVAGRPYEQRLVSDRAPSVQESGDVAFPRLLQYDIFPLRQDLVLDGNGDTVASRDIDVAVRFSEGVQNVRVEFYSVDLSESDAGTGTVVLQAESVSLGLPVIENPAGDGGVYYVGSIPAGDYVFPEGVRHFRVVAETTELPPETFVAGSREVRFDYDGEPPWPSTPDPDVDPGDDDDEPEPPGEIAEVGPVLVTANDPVGLDNVGGNRVLCSTITIDFSVTSGLIGGDDGDVVELHYFYGNQGSTPGSVVVPPLAPVSDGAANFQHEFEAGQDYGFRNNQSTGFTVRVRRDGNVVGSATSSATVAFNNNNNC